MINLWKTCNFTNSSKTNLANTLVRKFKEVNKYSTQVAVKDSEDKELTRTVEKLTKIRTKEIKRKPQKPPFAKNLLLGVFDTDILAYPEVLEKSYVDNLETDILPVKDYFENIDDRTERSITQNYLRNLSNLRVIGLQVPSFHGGRELTITESCRFFEEISRNTNRIGIIDSELLGISILLKHENDSNKKYIEQLVDGKTVIGCCISEADLSPTNSLKTKATLSSDGKMWTLNGTKKWVVNGDTADLFIVFAETEKSKAADRGENTISAFIVERRFGGIISTPCEGIGLNQTDVANVTFENTSVPAENLIGELGLGNKIISSALLEYRLSRGPVCISLLKSATNKFVNHCINISDTQANNIMETDVVQAKIGELTTALYAIESITYLTAGLLDGYDNQDCELESAIVKAVSTDYCHKSIQKIMDFMGTTTFMKGDWCNQLYCDSLGHLLLHEPVDNLKIIISLLGLQHAGIALQEKIRKYRNPIFHPGVAFRRMWTQKRHIEDKPKLTLRLYEYLHPSLTNSAQFLEYAVLRLQFATETLLARHGGDIVHKHIELKLLSDCIMDVYAMTAVLGRASRSYCIGLRHGELEMHIAAAFTVKAMERVKINVGKIWKGTYNTADEKYLKIGKYLIKHKEYFPVHPLARNY